MEMKERGRDELLALMYEFLHAVARMRKLQKSYSETKSLVTLGLAKDAEKEVDDHLDKLLYEDL